MSDATSQPNDILLVAPDELAGDLPTDFSSGGETPRLSCQRKSSVSEGTAYLQQLGASPGAPLPVALIVRVREYDPALDPMMSGFFRQIGPFFDHVAIICEHFDAKMLTLVYEYGVENLFTPDQWKRERILWTMRLRKSLQEPAWSYGHSLTRMVRCGDHVGLSRALAQADRSLECDYRVNFVIGKAQEVVGNIAGATAAFKGAVDRNPHFVLAKSAYASVLSQMGKKDEALQIQEEMQRRNSGSVERQVALAALHMERGDLKKAEEFAAAAEKFSDADPRALEARAQILLTQGKSTELMPLLDRISEGGQLLAARLNDMAIALAKSGNIDGAIELYKKTHRIVRPDLKFKVTLNVALTYLKTKQVEKCSHALDQCEREFGGSFEKLTKMREALATVKTAA